MNIRIRRRENYSKTKPMKFEEFQAEIDWGETRPMVLPAPRTIRRGKSASTT